MAHVKDWGYISIKKYRTAGGTTTQVQLQHSWNSPQIIANQQPEDVEVVPAKLTSIDNVPGSVYQLCALKLLTKVEEGVVWNAVVDDQINNTCTNPTEAQLQEYIDMCSDSTPIMAYHTRPIVIDGQKVLGDHNLTVTYIFNQ